MRGKNIDSEFVSKFIQDCTSRGFITTDDICRETLSKIQEIDEQLIFRNKLRDVLTHFSYKKNKTVVEKNIINFKELDRGVCYKIIELLGEQQNITLSEFRKFVDDFEEDYKNEYILNLKLMLEFNVLERLNCSLIKGSGYEEYLKFTNEKNI